MPHPLRLFIISGTAVSYYLLYQLNIFLFGSLNFSHRVDWVFLPSGLRLAFVLLFLGDGAIGIALASTLITYLMYFDGSYVSMVLSGSLAGLAPYIARLVAIHWFNLEENLVNIKNIGLFKISVLFAIISAVVHQLWYFWIGKTSDFIDSALVMMVGDWLGTVLVLTALQICIVVTRKLKQR